MRIFSPRAIGFSSLTIYSGDLKRRLEGSYGDAVSQKFCDGILVKVERDSTFTKMILLYPLNEKYVSSILLSLVHSHHSNV